MNNPKRVLIFALTYYPKFVGGDGVAVKEITDRISEEEMIFDMVTLRLDKTQSKFEKFGNVNVYRVGFSKNNPTPEELLKFPMYLTKVCFPVTAFLKAMSLQRKNKYDLVWGMMAYAGLPAVLFNFFHSKIPFLLTLQDGDPIEKIAGRTRIKIIMPIFKRIFKIAKHVHAISNYLGNFARKMEYNGGISVIANGVDYKKFSSFDSVRVSEIKDELNKNENDFWLFTASRLVEKNANDIVIRALERLPGNVKFVIAGIGPDREMLKSLAMELKVEDRVIFLGQISHNDLPNYLRASDAFIRPSRTEGFGNSFVEAMAAEIPVIATTAGGIADFLFDNENGLEVQIDSIDDVVSKTNLLMGDFVLKEKIVKNGREMVIEKYDWSNITSQMKELLTKTSN
ncbi:MAG: glycosyltransferase family 4 protein [Candidatus Pacebacteria bacterium]|nr:glycosyltransferase family 4 protein [Candidatus Paceibacterota bacterium]